MTTEREKGDSRGAPSICGFVVLYLLFAFVLILPVIFILSSQPRSMATMQILSTCRLRWPWNRRDTNGDVQVDDELRFCAYSIPSAHLHSRLVSGWHI